MLMIVDLRKSAATRHHTRGGTLSGIKPEILRELDFLIVVCCMAGDARTVGFFRQEMRNLISSGDARAEIFLPSGDARAFSSSYSFQEMQDNFFRRCAS